ncbi:MAG: NAD-dependent epimerase/dehydratase family protein [Gemmatimonadales bacterium]|nr:MAG: NAD-dependent epimerase/dehydratase family protein [Gemmatimonadales bacterium]
MNTPSSTVVVTGGAGFIGSHVCQAYLDAGWQVIALDNLSSGKLTNVPDGVEFVEMDVRSDSLPQFMRDRRPTLVNHHAAQIDVRVSVADPRLDASINVDGWLNVLESARTAGVGRVIYVSSGGVVYGEPEVLPTGERAPKAPISPYGVSKLAGEHYLFYYRKVHGLEGVALRYSNVYGPRQDPHGEAGVIAVFCRRLLEGSNLTIFGDGEQTRDYVYVGDVAAANLAVSESPLPDPQTIDDVAFNVATGIEVSVCRLAETLLKVAGQQAEIDFAAARQGELLRSSLDTASLRAAGWLPEIDLTEGLRRTYEYIAEHL